MIKPFFIRKTAPFIYLFFIGIFVISCSSIPKNPKGIENACDILKTNPSWYDAFNDTYHKYGVPPHVIMAIIYQESRFISDARPPKKTFLGISLFRPSNAFGYAQALDETWDWYKNKTSNWRASRENIVDAVDFIGWYVKNSHERTGLSKWDTRDQYIAYHEGAGGYLKGTHQKKAWLIKVANKVDRHANLYRQQLQQCYTFPKI